MSQAEELQWLLGEPAQRRALLEEFRPLLPEAPFQRIVRIVELVGWLLALLQAKDLTLTKLRKLRLGFQTESTRHLYGRSAQPNKPTKAKGHGRNSHRCYTGARRVRVAHPTLTTGQRCPDCQKGRLRPRKEPAVAITVTAQPPVGAVIHQMEQLRCDTCGKMFTAPTPPEAGTEKYDVSVGAMVGLMRYGSGMPFYRLERLQKSLGVPLPSSVQWEQAARVAEALKPVYEHLLFLAAQAYLISNDDTRMAVTQLRKAIQAQTNPKRTGIFTSGIVCEEGSYLIALFFTGRDHAGENLARVLERRQEHREAPLHMCDGLAHNAPKDHATIQCNCNVHARRNFVDIQSSFPQECRTVIEAFAEIYRVEAQAKLQRLSPQERLQLHQSRSQPVMDELHRWFAQQFEQKKVEPNSGLGQAIEYMQNRWTALTQFLRVAGAPLDNNSAERILKMCILHRKNSLFYRTQRGADVGDLFMSLVETCRANGANPFDYMLAVLRNSQAANADPDRWMPWNFRLALASASAPSG